MKKTSLLKRSLSIAFSLTLAAAFLPAAAAYSSDVCILSASAAEEVSENEAISEPVFDDEYPYQQAVYNTVKGTTVKLTKKNKGFLSKLFGKKRI